MRVFFTADTHFGHGGARGLFRRPFASIAAMDEALVRGWNEAVDAGDVVWHLGDFAVRQPERRLQELFLLLAGTKHLVAGNNDGEATRALPWASVGDYAEISESGTLLVLCHYPLRTWNRVSRGAWNLHGHSHGRLAPLRRQADVGVDVWDFRPVTLAQVRDGVRGRRAARASGRAVTSRASEW